MSWKPGELGFGLHFPNEFMKSHGGRLLIPLAEDVGLSEGFSGAIVALALVEAT